MGVFNLNGYYTLIAATFVLLLGRYMVKKIKALNDYNIPEPVAGGLFVALIVMIIHYVSSGEFAINVDKDFQNGLMLMFFSSIGLGADFSRLKAGGKPLLIFTFVVGAFIIVQNIVGVGLAALFGIDKLTGLVAGSITLTGGHGTALGWTEALQSKGLENAAALGVACATFGLILGGLIGGPAARFLLKRGKVKTPGVKDDMVDDEGKAKAEPLHFERPLQVRLITAESAIETLALFSVCLAGQYWINQWFRDWMASIGSSFTVPAFVWAILVGIIVRNLLTHYAGVKMFDRSIDVFGNVALSLFLAMAIMSLQFWTLAGLAIPVLIILAVQTVFMVLWAIFVTYRIMGKDYDAVVLTAGHCGFGMGATPTAVANMQAITQKFGDSHKAFLIVPLVGAFFVDIINAVILSFFVNLV